MAKTEVIDTVSFPTWALSALVNGDISGIEDHPEDVAMVEKFETDYNERASAAGYTSVIFSPDMNSDPYFTWRPKFGLACECVPVTIIFVK